MSKKELKKVSVKSIIEEGIRANRTTKAILTKVQKLRPDSVKTDEASIRYYANALIRAGELDKELAAKKYGCGTRGRKVDPAKKPAEKKPAEKKPAAKKPAAKKPAAKKSASPKKSATTKNKKA